MTFVQFWLATLILEVVLRNRQNFNLDVLGITGTEFAV